MALGKIEYVWNTEAGYPAYIVKMDNSNGKYRCGYVLIEKDHPLYNVEQEQLPILDIENVIEISRARMKPKTSAYELGFQTGTYDPKDIPKSCRETYKTKEFAIKECEAIARNLKKFKENYIR